MNSRFNAASETYTLQQEYSIAAFTTSLVTTVGSTKVFLLSDLPMATALAAVFDQYRFLKVEAWFAPPASQATPGAPEAGYWVSVPDLDDASAATFAQVQQKVGAVQTPVLVGHYHSFRPKAALAMYAGAFTSFGQAGDGWLDCSSPNIQHYGLKTMSSITNTVLGFSAVYRYTLQFRGTA